MMTEKVANGLENQRRFDRESGLRNPKLKELKERLNDISYKRKITIRKGSKKYLRAVVRSVMAWFWLRKQVDSTKLKRRKEKI